MIRRPPRSTQSRSSAASDVYKRQDLVAKGSASPAAALAVGRSIEKLDIADLQQRESASKHSDVTTVFQQLERGSNMHLRAFTR